MNDNLSIVHTDFFGCYNIWPKLVEGDKPEQNIYKYILENISSNILIPTFNYDFCVSNFSSSNVESQLGSFSEFFRNNLSVHRSFDPIFSFNSNKEQNFLVRDKITAFDDYSDFGNLDKENGNIIYVGTNLSFVSTYIHRIEFEYNVNYRYNKIFRGKYTYNKKNYNIEYNYKVWPKTNLPISYDCKKINSDLINNNILKIKKTKNGYYFMFCKVENFKKHILNHLNKDPYYLLSEDSKIWIEKKISNLKRSFKIEDFE